MMMARRKAAALCGAALRRPPPSRRCKCQSSGGVSRSSFGLHAGSSEAGGGQGPQPARCSCSTRHSVHAPAGTCVNLIHCPAFCAPHGMSCLCVPSPGRPHDRALCGVRSCDRLVQGSARGPHCHLTVHKTNNIVYLVMNSMSRMNMADARHAQLRSHCRASQVETRIQRSSEPKFVRALRRKKKTLYGRSRPA